LEIFLIARVDFQEFWGKDFQVADVMTHPAISNEETVSGG
jgi:hypothetical protein